MARKQDPQLARSNLGYRLAKASQRWNELLYERFASEGFAHVRPSFGSVLIPLFEEDQLRLGELARRGGVSKQTMTTMIRHVEAAGLVRRKRDTTDARAVLIELTAEARRFEPVAERALTELAALADKIDGPTEAERVADWLGRFAFL